MSESWWFATEYRFLSSGRRTQRERTKPFFNRYTCGTRVLCNEGTAFEFSSRRRMIPFTGPEVDSIRRGRGNPPTYEAGFSHERPRNREISIREFWRRNEKILRWLEIFLWQISRNSGGVISDRAAWKLDPDYFESIFIRYRGHYFNK